MPFSTLRRLFQRNQSQSPQSTLVSAPTFRLTSTERAIVEKVQQVLAQTDEEYSEEEVYAFLVAPMQNDKTLLDAIKSKFSDNLNAMTTERLVKVVGFSLFNSLDMEDKLDYIMEMAEDSLDLPELEQDELDDPDDYCLEEDEEYDDY